MIDFVIKQGDTLPILEAAFTDSVGAIDLTNASVDFFYRLKNSTSTPVSGNMTVTDPLAGEATYFWTTGDTITPGMYVGEFVVTFPTTKQLSFPTDSFIVFEVVKDIN